MGNQLVCNEETYQVNYLPNLTYNWVLSNGNAQLISGQGTSIRIKKDTQRNNYNNPYCYQFVRGEQNNH